MVSESSMTVRLANEGLTERYRTSRLELIKYMGNDAYVAVDEAQIYAVGENMSQSTVSGGYSVTTQTLRQYLEIGSHNQ